VTLVPAPPTDATRLDITMGFLNHADEVELQLLIDLRSS
jgi:hypothetical protein